MQTAKKDPLDQSSLFHFLIIELIQPSPRHRPQGSSVLPVEKRRNYSTLYIYSNQRSKNWMPRNSPVCILCVQTSIHIHWFTYLHLGVFSWCTLSTERFTWTKNIKKKLYDQVPGIYAIAEALSIADFTHVLNSHTQLSESLTLGQIIMAGSWGVECH